MCLSSFDEQTLNLIMFFNMNMSYKNTMFQCLSELILKQQMTSIAI